MSERDIQYCNKVGICPKCRHGIVNCICNEPTIDQLKKERDELKIQNDSFRSLIQPYEISEYRVIKEKLDLAIKELEEARDELFTISCATRFGDRIQAANADSAKRCVDLINKKLQKLRGEK